MVKMNLCAKYLRQRF